MSKSTLTPEQHHRSIECIDHRVVELQNDVKKNYAAMDHARIRAIDIERKDLKARKRKHFTALGRRGAS